MLSQDITNILEDRFTLKQWEIYVELLLLRQRALDLEAALAAKTPLPPPRPFHYSPGYCNLVPPQFLRPASINTIADAMVVFGD